MKDKHAQKHKKCKKKATGQVGSGPSYNQINGALNTLKTNVKTDIPPNRTLTDQTLINAFNVIAEAIHYPQGFSQDQLSCLRNISSWYFNSSLSKFQSEVQRGLTLFSSQKKAA